ncbi:phage tail protein [Kingella kingae]|uniref:phage tail protein n=1 Tax=Kingella kingae TaxID=504 RepID=UPI00254AEC34|nr:phage tail protein [Kingella kingae]MDK4645396.1 phage tail protein [Kingella kingae]
MSIYFDYGVQTFFDDSIHETVPQTAQTITAEQHQAFLNALNQGAYITQDLQIVPRPSTAHVWQNGKWHLDKQAQQAAFQAAKTAKLAELNAAAQHYINRKAGVDNLPDFEVQTWAIQAIEAKAWHNDKNADTPTLDGIAAARGIKPDTLKQKAYEKAIAFEALAAHAVGIRQAVETLIKKAKDLEELNAIEFGFRDEA